VAYLSFPVVSMPVVELEVIELTCERRGGDLSNVNTAPTVEG